MFSDVELGEQMGWPASLEVIRSTKNNYTKKLPILLFNPQVGYANCDDLKCRP